MNLEKLQIKILLMNFDSLTDTINVRCIKVKLKSIWKSLKQEFNNSKVLMRKKDSLCVV